MAVPCLALPSLHLARTHARTRTLGAIVRMHCSPFFNLEFNTARPDTPTAAARRNASEDCNKRFRSLLLGRDC